MFKWLFRIIFFPFYLVLWIFKTVFGIVGGIAKVIGFIVMGLCILLLIMLF